MFALCQTVNSSPLTLADSDVQTERGWVVVLKEIQFGAARVLHFVADGLASRALKGGDEVGITGRDSKVPIVFLHCRGVVVGGRLGGSGLEGREVNLAVAAEGVRRGLKIFLLGEEEDKAARLSSVRGGDVKIENGRDGGRDGAIERRASSRIG